MEASTVQQAGYPPTDAHKRRAALVRVLRMGVSDGGKFTAGDATISALETELALLREENAQLKVDRHRPAGVGHVIERMRALQPDVQPQLQTDAQPQLLSDASDETQKTFAEVLVLRESLIEACREVQQAIGGIRSKLGALSGELQSHLEERSGAELPQTNAEDSAEGKLLDTSEATHELVRSVA